MARFTIRDLLYGTALIAIAFGLRAIPVWWVKLIAYPFFFGGLFAPFGDVKRGVMYGLGVVAAVWAMPAVLWLIFGPPMN